MAEVIEYSNPGEAERVRQAFAKKRLVESCPDFLYSTKTGDGVAKLGIAYCFQLAQFDNLEAAAEYASRHSERKEGEHLTSV